MTLRGDTGEFTTRRLDGVTGNLFGEPVERNNGVFGDRRCLGSTPGGV